MSYDRSFFEYVDNTALPSAEVIVPLMLGALRCRSVLDVGCGTGAWLSVYARHGVGDVMGLDGAYVDVNALMIPSERFVKADLRSEFDLKRRFDLVESLEVAEHLPPPSSDVFVDSLTRHGGLILFSAAVPGQGGEDHINEQPYEQWRARFAARRFVPFDFLRPRLRATANVAAWYAYNALLYAHQSVESSLPEQVRVTRVPDDRQIDDVSPALFRARKAILRQLPPAVVTQLSRLNRRLLHKSNPRG